MEKRGEKGEVLLGKTNRERWVLALLGGGMVRVLKHRKARKEEGIRVERGLTRGKEEEEEERRGDGGGALRNMAVIRDSRSRGTRLWPLN